MVPGMQPPQITQACLFITSQLCHLCIIYIVPLILIDLEGVAFMALREVLFLFPIMSLCVEPTADVLEFC